MMFAPATSRDETTVAGALACRGVQAFQSIHSGHERRTSSPYASDPDSWPGESSPLRSASPYCGGFVLRMAMEAGATRHPGSFRRQPFIELASGRETGDSQRGSIGERRFNHPLVNGGTRGLQRAAVIPTGPSSGVPAVIWAATRQPYPRQNRVDPFPHSRTFKTMSLDRCLGGPVEATERSRLNRSLDHQHGRGVGRNVFQYVAKRRFPEGPRGSHEQPSG